MIVGRESNIRVFDRIMELTQTQLEDVILYHKFLYYESGTPMIEDEDYDKLHNTLMDRFPDSFLAYTPGFPAEYHLKYYARHQRRLTFSERMKKEEEKDMFVFL